MKYNYLESMVEDVKEKMSRYFDVTFYEDFVEDEKILVIGDKKWLVLL